LVPAGFLCALVLLPIISIFWSRAIWIWVNLLGFYFTLSILLSLVTASMTGWKLFPLLPPVFWTFHLAYGWGFLRGFADFIVLRRKRREAYIALTRASSE